jgi:Spa2 homology domain (SHD) of GIT
VTFIENSSSRAQRIYSLQNIMNRPSFGPTILTPPLEIRLVARIHYDEFRKYLTSYLAKGSIFALSSSSHPLLTYFLEPVNPTARKKLVKLTHKQFQELSTDVYDELIRRENNLETDHGTVASPSMIFSNSLSISVPFLPPRDDLHPKRNHARQNLATLLTDRFEDLSSEIYYELLRRHPEFKEETSPNTPVSDYDPYTFYASSGRRPSQDTIPTVRSEHQDLARCPSDASGSDSTGATDPQKVTATDVPTKSTTVEENIHIEVSSGHNHINHEKVSFRGPSFDSDRSARGVGWRVSIARSLKRGATNRSHKPRVNAANDSKRNAPQRCVHLPPIPFATSHCFIGRCQWNRQTTVAVVAHSNKYRTSAQK